MKEECKHAYLIIAHSEFELLSYQLKLIDDDRNDIFLHIDPKSNFNNVDMLKSCVKKSKIEIYSEIDVRWGSESQVECEIFLIKKACNTDNYSYYHILSGVDLPIKSQDYIHEFFKEHNGKEFVHFDTKPVLDINKDRVEYFHYLNNFFKVSNIKIINYIIGKMDNFLVKLQKIMKIKKKIEFKEIQKGCNWCSITNGFAKYLLENEKKIEKLVYKSKCADEVFIQTLLENSEFKNRLFDNNYNNNYHACLRLIIWDNKNNIKRPKTFNIDDYEKIINSEELFARKFSCKKDAEVVNKIFDKVKGEI